MTDHIAIAKDFVKNNLKELCKELLFQATGGKLLANAKKWELVELCAYAGLSRYSVAELFIKDAAMQAVAYGKENENIRS